VTEEFFLVCTFVPFLFSFSFFFPFLQVSLDPRMFTLRPIMSSSSSSSWTRLLVSPAALRGFFSFLPRVWVQSLLLLFRVSLFKKGLSSVPTSLSIDKLSQDFRKLMRRVPASVFVITTGDDQGHKRGITVGSLTSVSLQPAIVSFCIQKPSRMHDLLSSTKKFSAHLLRKDQVCHP